MILQITFIIISFLAFKGTLYSVLVGDLQETLACLVFWVLLSFAAIALLTTPVKYIPFFKTALAIIIALAWIFHIEVY